MAFSYNGSSIEIDPFKLPLVGENIAVKPASVTYFTAVHTTSADFDPTWAEAAKEADVVFHEEFAWPPAAKLALDGIANGAKPVEAYTSNEDSYAYRRLSSVFATRIRQEFWDASAAQAGQYNLFAKQNTYHKRYAIAENLLAQRNLPEAIVAMQSAKKILATYDALRDGIGVTTIMNTINKLQKTEPKIVVFAGSAHLYQAAFIAHKMPASDKANGVIVESPIEDPFSAGVHDYDCYIRKQIPRTIDTLHDWLTSIRRQQLEAKFPNESHATIHNIARAEVVGLSEEEAAGQLMSSAA